jgi:hypothetical protein
MNNINEEQGLNPQRLSNDSKNNNEEKILILEARIKNLNDICGDLNPYKPIDQDLKLRLKTFNIMEFNDPFKITNALLILLEDSIDELHILKPFNDN